MKIFINYLKQKNKLLDLSISITLVILCAIFIVLQILSFSSLTNLSEQPAEQMEVRELIKLQFTPPKIQPQVMREQKTLEMSKQPSRDKPAPQPTAASFNIVSMVEGLNMKKLVSHEAMAAKRGSSLANNPNVAGVSTEVSRAERTLDNFDLSGVMEDHNASFAPGRRSSPGGANGPRVGIGGTSHLGTGTGDGGDGLALSGRGTARAARGFGNGSGGGATISLPSGNGGGSAALDIHALIKWMKAHPGTIPKLVAYDMGHRADDLSSAVSFTSNGRNYTLFLSCNEVELLLRICLVDGNDFTLLKDNGIQESSNFLTVGDVVRDAQKIQSLISSRKAPGDRAAVFYQIFWSWWLRQPESRG
ncbi:MAG: hypothetical protein ONB27_05425 [candidate division KSB1 bacterium]|nr:hypothetical protein [candidate division KSB1 bacterium]